MSPGMSTRPRTMTMAGIVLSHPEMVTSPSNMWLRATSSTESATTSRLMSEPFMPSVPMVMPSLMAMVLTSMGVPPAARIPCITFSASLRWFQLHGIVPIQLCATPIWGRTRSWSLKPTAFIMARAGARSGPSRRTRLWRRGSTGISDSFWIRRRGASAPDGRGSHPPGLDDLPAFVSSRILQQVGERGEGIARLPERSDETRQRLHDPSARPRHAVGVVEVEDGPRLHSFPHSLHLQRRSGGPAALGLHGPEDAGRVQTPEHREHGEIAQPPWGAEEARGAPGGQRDGVVALDDLALGLAGSAEPEAPVTPGVIAEVRALVEGESHTARRSPTAPEASRVDHVRAPRVRRPERGRRREPEGGGHDARSRATPCPASTRSTIWVAARGRR